MTQQIGQYRILEELGAGGMGIVYRALDAELQREVALKRLRSEFAASPEVLERFRNEAKMQGRMNHPNIAQLYSLVQTADAFCIVMELVDGVVVKDLQPLPWQLAVLVIAQTLDALGYAHGLGVLHRDIKPENILIDRRGAVKVMDFGIAYAVGSQRMTREKSILGTIEYMAPERILGQPMDARSDIYAIGILLFELLSGRLPFDAASEYDLMRWHLEESPMPVTTCADVPAFLDEVIRKAMAKAPQDRYANCAGMAAHLQALAPPFEGSSESLQALVAQCARARRPAHFDERQCCALAARQIADGNLEAAESLLRSELGHHPRVDALRQFHAVVMRGHAAAASAAPGTEERETILGWMRLIAAERTADRAGFSRELERMRAGFPQWAVAELLEVREAGREENA